MKKLKFLFVFLFLIVFLVSFSVNSFAFGNVGESYGSPYNLYSVFPLYDISFNRLSSSGNYIISNHPTNNILNVNSTNGFKVPQSQTSGSTTVKVYESLLENTIPYYRVDYTFDPSYYGPDTLGTVSLDFGDFYWYEGYGNYTFGLQSIMNFGPKLIVADNYRQSGDESGFYLDYRFSTYTKVEDSYSIQTFSGNKNLTVWSPRDNGFEVRLFDVIRDEVGFASDFDFIAFDRFTVSTTTDCFTTGKITYSAPYTLLNVTEYGYTEQFLQFSNLIDYHKENADFYYESWLDSEDTIINQDMQISDLISSKNDLQNQYDELYYRWIDETSGYSQLQEEYERLKAQLDSLGASEDVINQLREEIDQEYREYISDLYDSIEIYKSENSKLENDIDILEKKNKELDDINTDLRSDLLATYTPNVFSDLLKGLTESIWNAFDELGELGYTYGVNADGTPQVLTVRDTLSLLVIGTVLMFILKMIRG